MSAIDADTSGDDLCNKSVVEVAMHMMRNTVPAVVSRALARCQGECIRDHRQRLDGECELIEAAMAHGDACNTQTAPCCHTSQSCAVDCDPVRLGSLKWHLHLAPTFAPLHLQTS